MKPKRKTWKEKMADKEGFPKIFEIDHTMSKRWGTGTCVIVQPSEVNELMRHVRKGKVTTIDELRKALARRHRTTIACPITTGIFAWIAAHAAEEQASAGKKSTTPYWRTLKTGGEINPKYPGGVAALKQKLSAEGHEIVRKRDRYFVSNFADALGKIQ